MDFAHLDSGSEWAANRTAFILLQEGKLSEARQGFLKAAASSPIWREDRDLFLACTDSSQASELDRVAHKSESSALNGTDSEGRYFVGRLLGYCGQRDAAVRLLKSAIAQNYCANTALQTDPLLSKLRGTPEMSELLSQAKNCQNQFLAQIGQSSR